MLVRTALGDDATAISRVVLSALHETNAREYVPEIVARVARSYTPERFAAQTAELQVFVGVQVFVALEGSLITSTAIRDGSDVRAASEAGIAALTLQSFLTASGFCLRLGFRVVREHLHGDERTIVMERRVAPMAEPGVLA